MFVLDTDSLGILQNKRGVEYDALQNRIAQEDPATVFVSIISFQEQIQGWNAYIQRGKKSRDLIKAYRMFESIIQDFGNVNVLSFDDAASRVYDNLKARHLRVATMDTRIAAISLSRHFMVITRNLVDFTRIPGLACQDWTLPRKQNV